MQPTVSRPSPQPVGEQGMPGWAVIFFIVAAVLGLVVLPRLAAKGAFVGKPVPAITLGALDPSSTAAPVALAGLQGHVVVLDFWASWCGPCKQQMPVLDRLAKKHAADGVEVIGVLVDENRDGARAFLDRAHIGYPQLDGRETAARAFDVRSLPSLVVVDARGVIRSYDVGYHDEETIERRIRDAM